MTIVAVILFGIICIWGIGFLMLWFFQDCFLYTRHRVPRKRSRQIAALGARVETVAVVVDQDANVQLRGWWVRNSPLPKASAILYLGGQGDELSEWVMRADCFGDWSVLFVNYRGYGASDGRPSEARMLADALAVYDYLIARPDVDRDKIVIMGRSLGTGVATYLATQRPAVGVILVSPYDSVLQLAQAKLTCFPVERILNNRYEAITHAPEAKLPLLALLAERDRMIPKRHSLKLIEAWAGPKQVKVIHGKSHNTIFAGEGYWSSIHEFLNRFC